MDRHFSRTPGHRHSNIQPIIDDTTPTEVAVEPIEQFISDHGLTMTAEPVDANPNIPDADVNPKASHFTVTIKGRGGALMTFYSVGSGTVDSWIGNPERKRVNHKGWFHGAGMFDSLRNREDFRRNERTLWSDEFRQMMAPLYRPELTDVLDCLASDASTVEYVRNFEDWADELGYDSDSRHAEQIYNTIERQAKELRYILATREVYERLLFEVERM